MAKTEITFPIGRMVAGSLYRPRDKDAEGKPLVFKNGPKAGQPRVEYSFGVAYAKTAAGHWANEPWGRPIWEAGHKVLPTAGNPDSEFAWKVVDGDSTKKSRKGQGPANCEREGYPGHWIVYFANGFEPQIYDATGQVKLTAPDVVKRGYYVQVHGNVDGNNSQSNPGLFINHQFVAFAGEGDVIAGEGDASGVGFGQGVAAPVGMRPVTPTPAQAAGLGAAPPPPAAPAPAPAPAAAPQATYAPPPAAPAPAAPVAVAPNPGMTAVPAPLAPAGHAAPPPTTTATPPAAPTPPSAPPAPISPSSGPQMTAKAQQAGYTYASLQAAQWTDEQMRAEGYIV